MRIKLVALVERPLVKELQERDVRIKSHTTYKESLLLHMKGAYGLPELVGIRYPPEHEEKAQAVHYGHDIRNQEESVLESGEKDQLTYKYIQLGFTPVGEFTVDDLRFEWREFEGKHVCIKELGLCFLSIFRKFPGSDTEVFAEKQKRAWMFLKSLGIKKEQLLPVDYWGFLITQMLQQMKGGSNPPQS